MTLALGLGMGSASADWTTYHLDSRRDANAGSEKGIAGPSSALWTTNVDHFVYAEPLVFGSQVIVATENDTVYSLDLGTGNVNWSRSVAGQGRKAVPNSHIPCGNIYAAGVTGTPVIDPATGRLFVVALAWDGVNESTIHHYLWALDLNAAGNPVVAGLPIDPVSPDFNPAYQGERAALALAGGHVYAAFGGRAGDCEPPGRSYHGWIVRAEEDGTNLVDREVNAGGSRGGIWATSGPAIDDSGSVFVATGNGNQFDNTAPSDLTDSVVRLSPDLQVMDHFTPQNFGTENQQDADLGSAGPMLIGGGLLYQVGKSGTVYLLNTASLGGGNDKGGEAFAAAICAGFGGSAFDPGRDVIYSTCTDGTRALQVHRVGSGACAGIGSGTEPCLQPIWQGPSDASGPPILVGDTVWVRGSTFGASQASLYGLRATDGSTTAQFDVAATAHFATPTYSGGILLLASDKSIKAFGQATSWYSLGGSSSGRTAVGKNADGRLEGFARAPGGQIHHLWQVAPGSSWSPWYSLGGSLSSDPSVVLNRDGRMELFAVGADGGLWHNWQVAPGRPWAGWYPLGGSLTGRPALARNADGRLEAFGRGADNALWHTWQTSPGGGWSAIYTLGGSITDDPATGTNADGRVEAFSLSAGGGAIAHLWQVVPGGGWSAWSSLGGAFAGAPTVASNQDGRLEVLARGTGQAVWHASQSAPNSGWFSFTSLGGAFNRGPVVSSNADGRLEAFAVGLTGELAHASQSWPGGAWASWSSLPGLAAAAAPGVSQNADGRLELFAPIADGSVWHTWQKNPGRDW